MHNENTEKHKILTWGRNGVEINGAKQDQEIKMKMIPEVRKSRNKLAFMEKRKSGNGGKRGKCRRKWCENNEKGNEERRQ